MVFLLEWGESGQDFTVRLMNLLTGGVDVVKLIPVEPWGLV